MFSSLEKVRLDAFQSHLPDKKICFDLKLIVILIDLLVHNMLGLDESLTEEVLTHFLNTTIDNRTYDGKVPNFRPKNP